MKRAFKIRSDSKFIKEWLEYKSQSKEQRKFCIDFMDTKGIKANKFSVGGNGFINKAFEEHQQGDIYLNIIPTNEDLEQFRKYLTKPSKSGLSHFKRNSSIAKEFSKMCIKNKVIINLREPSIRELFKEIQYSAYRWRFFEYKGKYYTLIEADDLTKNETPDGFQEIKLSEFYKILEESEGCEV